MYLPRPARKASVARRFVGPGRQSLKGASIEALHPGLTVSYLAASATKHRDVLHNIRMFAGPLVDESMHVC